MAYFFQHPVHTVNAREFIGESETEAYEILTEWGFDADEIFNLAYEGHVFQKDPGEVLNNEEA